MQRTNSNCNPTFAAVAALWTAHGLTPSCICNTYVITCSGTIADNKLRAAQFFTNAVDTTTLGAAIVGAWDFTRR
jgi:hypothetical protein